MTVILTVHLDCGHDLTYQDSIEEKYPFYCETCDDTPTGKYPWSIETRVEDADEQVCNCPCSSEGGQPRDLYGNDWYDTEGNAFCASEFS